MKRRLSSNPPELQEKVASIQPLVEARLGEKIQRCQVLQYRQSVVAGHVYHLKILVDNDDDDDDACVHVKVYEPLPYYKKPMEIMSVEKEKRDDELVSFTSCE